MRSVTGYQWRMTMSKFQVGDEQLAEQKARRAANATRSMVVEAIGKLSAHNERDRETINLIKQLLAERAS
jgi:hypothetical protein